MVVSPLVLALQTNEPCKKKKTRNIMPSATHTMPTLAKGCQHNPTRHQDRKSHQRA